MTSYFKDNCPNIIWDDEQEPIFTKLVNHLSKSKNANIYNSIAGVLGIVGGLIFLGGLF